MVQKVAEEKAGADQSAPPQPRAKSGKLVLIVGLVALFITAQAVITYLLMPKAAPPKAEDSATAKPAPPASPNGDDDATEAATETFEVPMGDFNCTNSTDPGMVVHVNFKLVAVTAAGSSASKLESQLKLHSGRVRQLVNQIVRRSSLEDLNDPSLNTIKRSIRQEVNKLLRNTSANIDEIVISDITTMQQ